MLNWQNIIAFANQGNPIPDHVLCFSEAEWKARLNENQYRIMRQHGTERAFSDQSCNLFEPGFYCCVGCETMLFDSNTKFNSQTGWPSFTQPFKDNAISYHLDQTLSQTRVEVRCNCCGSHLGHVFPDGPKPSELRYCINGAAIKKVEQKK